MKIKEKYKMKILLYKNRTINMNYFITCNLVIFEEEVKRTYINIILHTASVDVDAIITMNIEDFTTEQYYSKFKTYIEENPVDFMKHIKIMINSFLINSQSNTLDLNAEVYNLLNEGYKKDKEVKNE
jgi:hypothetical protein